MAVGLVAAAAVFGFYYQKARVATRRQNKSISVKGGAGRNIRSDRARWTGTLIPQAPSLQQLELQSPQVRNFLANKNFPAGQVQFSTVFTEPQFELSSAGFQTNHILGYSLRQNVTVESQEVDKVVEASIESSGLIRQGINFQSQPLQFFNSNIESLKMLGKAALNARERAEQLAQNTGSQVGKLSYASQGIFRLPLKTPRRCRITAPSILLYRRKLLKPLLLLPLQSTKKGFVSAPTLIVPGLI